LGLLLRARGSVSAQRTFRATPGPATRPGRPGGLAGLVRELYGMEVLYERVAGPDIGNDR
jgi:hypothetical protein